MTIKELMALAKSTAVKVGHHDDAETPDEFIPRYTNNVHNEASELHEAWRKGQENELCDKCEKMVALNITPLTYLEEELADLMITVAYMAEKLGVDLEKAIVNKDKYNQTRPWKHGGKKS